MSERRWRSGANRPSRQARRGWASLYEAPSQKKNHLPRATKIQQHKNFLLRINPLTTTSPHEKSLPVLSPDQTQAAPGLFRAKPGPIWVGIGLFGVDFGSILGFPGPKSRRFGAHSPLSAAPSTPGDVQKLHLSCRAPKRTSPTLISQIHTKSRYIITNNLIFTSLSL